MVKIAGIELTHPDRVMYPGQGATKQDIAAYYEKYQDHILPFLKDRPLSLLRCPQGRDEQCFFQKHHTSSTPDSIDEVEIEEKKGGRARYLLVRNVAGLVSTAQIGALELHIWPARADRLDRPERLVIDLDPDEGKDFADVRDAAMEVRDMLAEAGLVSFALLTGGKGIHVVAPLERRAGWGELKAVAKGLAHRLEARAPEKYIATASKAKREGKIYIDWLRNERGSTAIAPYSPRARKGAPVATPVQWDELPSVKAANAYTLDTIGNRLTSLKSDPWPDYFDLRQSIGQSQLDFFSED